MSDFVNYLIAALLCAFLFTDLRFDYSFPDLVFSIPNFIVSELSVPSFPTLIALLLAFYIFSNWGS